MRTYKNETLKNILVTLKIDGVRVIQTSAGAFSRADKPLMHVPASLPNGTYECFIGSFKTTISRLTTIDGEDIEQQHFYRLDRDFLDPRLRVGFFETLEAEQVRALFDYWSYLYEGLVLRPAGETDIEKWLKVKAVVTHDLIVTGIKLGKGRLEGKIGGLVTDKCIVGSGLTDELRSLDGSYWLGKTIEVEAMEETDSGKLRHPRFIRIREDK